MSLTAKNIHVEFLKSCAGPADLPATGRPEIAVLGRSNVGKSSLLNTLFDRDLAEVSKTPGRTRLLNFFAVWAARAGQRRETLPELYLVDLPGYGFAKVAREMRERWNELVEPYLLKREQLRLSLLLIDSMIPPQAPDLDLHAQLRRRGRPVCLVATKCDRLSNNERRLALRRLGEAYGEPLLESSAKTGTGRGAIWARIAASAE